MQHKTSLVRNRRGAALVIVAVALSAMLSMLALSIDLGMLYKTHVEAQRAADASALAGASVFTELGIPAGDKVDSAEARALVLAKANYMTGGLIDSAEVTIQVIPDSEKVRVWVRRDSVPTWFARVFGIKTVPIGAKAAAEATTNGTATCVKPFLIPDFWEENSGDDALHPNQIWDFPTGEIPNKPSSCGTTWECWSYNSSAGDRYARYDEPDATGLGSTFRDAETSYASPSQYRDDYARPVMLYPSFPQYSPVPSNWYLWRIDCPGANCVRDAMTGCTTTPISVGQSIAKEQPGEARGAVQQGLEGWMAQDPTARFVETETSDASGTYMTGNVVSDDPTMMGEANPRVFIAGLISPDFLAPGYDEVPLNNMAKFFLESIPPSEGSKAPVQVRFLGFVTGTGDEGPDEGTLVKVLRLVE
jgi:Putative Flp pilus-assembly TadE/G-like